MLHTISADELKQIHLYRQHLTCKADKRTVCHDLNGIQAQFMSNVEHSLKIRCNEKIEKDKFHEGLVKNWTIRGTVHVFNQEDLPLFKYQTENRMYRSHDWDTAQMRRECRISPKRLEYISRLIVEKVSLGVGMREELKKECALSGVSEAESAFVFDQWGGLLRPLCERGFLAYKVREKREFMVCPPFTPLEEEAAIVEHARRYFTHFAPATVKDAAYYFRWTQAFAKEIMDKLPLDKLKVNDRDFYYLGELDSNYPDIPSCILLAGFDQLMLGYQKRDSIYLPRKNIRGIFNLAGIVMPAVLLDGVAVGRWRRKNAKVTFELFEDISAQNKRRIESKAEETFSGIRKTEWTLI